MRNYILAALTLALYVSADGGCNRKDKEAANSLHGKWRWVKTFCCGRTSVWSTPESCNCTRSLELKSDGSYVLMDNGEVTKEGTYMLRRGINDYQLSTGDEREAIVMDSTDAYYLSMNGDTLGVTMGYMDGPNYFYVKSE
jgi:hypothetical protein